MPSSLSPLRLLAYALPALPLAALTLPLYIVVPTYYAAGLGLSLAAIGQALLAVRIFDAITDPLVGVLADRTRPAFGRRRSWFILSVPLTVFAVYMLMVPPPDAGIGWLFGFGLLVSLGTTASLIPYTAWGAELSTDYAGRSRIAAARETVVVVGTLFATATPAAVQAAGVIDDGGTALFIIALAVVILLPITGILAVVMVPEPVEHSRIRLSLSDGLRQIRSNRPFLTLLGAYVLNGFANGLPATLFLFYVGSVLQAPDEAGLLLFIYFLCGVIGVLIWLRVARRLSKSRTWCIAMLFNVAVFASVPLLGAGDVTLFMVVCVLTGVALGADLVLPASIQADVIDVDTAASGEQRTGTYVAAWGLGTKLALAMAVGVAFPVLDAAGFSADGGPQSASGLTALIVLYAVVPLVMKLAAIALMWRFPLDAAEQARLRSVIEAKGR